MHALQLTLCAHDLRFLATPCFHAYVLRLVFPMLATLLELLHNVLTTRITTATTSTTLMRRTQMRIAHLSLADSWSIAHELLSRQGKERSGEKNKNKLK